MISVEFHKAVQKLWTDQGLDSHFSDLWESGSISESPVLHDQEAPPSQPFPYCIFEHETTRVTARMSGHDSGEKHEIRDISWMFRIHARQVSGRSAKDIASDLAQKIMAVFGGHFSSSPEDLVMDNGDVLISQYQTDWGIRTGDREYQWNLRYLFRIDIPVTV